MELGSNGSSEEARKAGLHGVNAQPHLLAFSSMQIIEILLKALHARFISEMSRPIETLLTLPRVRLISKVPIIETERLIERLLHRPEYRLKLAKNALRVSAGSAQQFSLDDMGLSTMLEEINTANYVVTKRSKTMMEEMLKGICGDGLIFKDFEKHIEPLYEVSQDLERVSKLADSLVDKTKEESLDVARALLIQLPKPTSAE
jgi:hypothetical protein